MSGDRAFDHVAGRACNERTRRWVGGFAHKGTALRVAATSALTDRSHLLHFVPVPMVVLIGIVAAAAGAVLAFWLTRSAAQRQLADERAALAAELATAKRDNEWFSAQIEREREGLGTLRDAFQALAADAMNSNRSAFLDLAKASFEGFQKEAALQFDSKQKAIDSLVAADH